MTSANVRLAPAGSDSTPSDITAAAERVGRITGAIRRDDTIVTFPDPTACDWNLTWTSDDVQLVAIADGAVDVPGDAEAFHTRVYTVRGTPPELELERLPGYPNMIMRTRESEFASYWGGSILAVDREVYQLLWTTNHPYLREDGTFWPDFQRYATKLVYSPDNGRTWNNQDGSHPVVWDDWDARTSENMLFIDEPHDGLVTGGSFLQMGQDYSLNTDGYVYGYFGMGDDLGLYRVPRGRIRDRGSYEFVTGRRDDGTAAWSSDSSEAGGIHRFPEGWTSTKGEDGMMPQGWYLNASYVPALGVYLLVASGVGVSDEGGWWAKPSYLGLWAAPTPWGPFTQFHEETAWTPGGDERARGFAPDIAPKWISEDGRSFWLVWSDIQFLGDNGEDYNPDAALVAAIKDIEDEDEFVRAFAAWMKKHLHNTVFHTQRVDLTVE